MVAMTLVYMRSLSVQMSRFSVRRSLKTWNARYLSLAFQISHLMWVAPPVVHGPLSFCNLALPDSEQNQLKKL